MIMYDYMVDHVSEGQESTNNFRALKAGYNMFASGRAVYSRSTDA